MRRLFINGGTFILAGLLLAIPVYQLSESTAPIFAFEEQRIQHFLERQNQIEAVTISNSHNLAIDYKALGINGYHLWIFGSDIQEANYTLRAFVDEIPNLKYVFLPLDFGFWGLDNGALMRFSRFGTYAQAAVFRHAPEWIDDSWKNHIRMFFMPIARPDHWAGVFKSLVFKSSLNERQHVTANGNYLQPPHSWQPDKADKARAHAAVNRHLGLIRESLKKNPTLKSLSLKSLHDIIRLTRERGITLILYTPPYSRQYIHDFRNKAPQIIKETELIIHRVQTETGAFYQDFSTYNPIYSNNNFFSDADHLNASGAKVFSKELANRLKLQDAKTESR